METTTGDSIPQPAAKHKEEGEKMSREKAGFRDTIAALNEMFPDQGMLSKNEVAKFLGVHRNTVAKRGIQFNQATGRVTKADLARQVCI
jgi:hypothetical protein